MDQSKTILLYTTNIYPCKIGGMEIYNYHLIKELAKTELERKLIVLSSCPETQRSSLSVFPERERGFILRRFGLGTASTVLYYCFSKKFRWKDVGVIYLPYTSNFSFNAVSFLILKKIFGIEYVVHIHSGGFRQSKPKWLLRSFFKNARHIAGVSHPIVEEYHKTTGREVRYLPPLLPFEESIKGKEALKIEKGFERFKRIILYVGSVKALKSPETLLKAYVELGEVFITEHQLGLIMVGDGHLRHELEEKYGDIDSIIFEGAIPNEEIKSYYKIADVYAITSWFEGTSISLLEAMFNQLPCVGTNVTGIKEIIVPGENGYLFEKDDYQQLAEIIKKLISDYAAATAIGENAYQYYSSKFNYANHLSEISKFMGVA